MKTYEVECKGWRVTVDASSYGTAISRALRTLKRKAIIKENDNSLGIIAKIKKGDECSTATKINP